MPQSKGCALDCAQSCKYLKRLNRRFTIMAILRNLGRAAGGAAAVALTAVAVHRPTRQHTMDAINSVPGALRGNAVGPLRSGPRSELDTAMRQHPNMQPFTMAVHGVNRSMDIHAPNAKLPKSKLASYIRDVARVQNGEISNTRAFASSAVGWAREGNAPAAALNAAGAVAAAVFEGVREDHRRKTGRR